jgi:hypothetical protein
MMAANYDIVCDQGATFQRVFTWQDSTGVPVNISGYTARMQVRATVSSSTILLSFTTENGGLTLGDAAGTITATATAATTAGVAAGCYVYDLELINGATVYRLVQGQFTVDGEVTR